MDCTFLNAALYCLSLQYTILYFKLMYIPHLCYLSFRTKLSLPFSNYAISLVHSIVSLFSSAKHVHTHTSYKSLTLSLLFILITHSIEFFCSSFSYKAFLSFSPFYSYNPLFFSSLSHLFIHTKPIPFLSLSTFPHLYSSCRPPL